MLLNRSLSHIRIVLVETSHPGNIGATARAMKVMGLGELHLVSPQRYDNRKARAEAKARASGADNILAQSVIHSDLASALAECHIAIGASARAERYLRWPLLTARECGEFVQQRHQAYQAQKHETHENEKELRIALVFGRERSGLNNEELAHCQYLVNIPTQVDYQSLNVASAVQILAYECAMAAQLESTPLEPKQTVRTAEELGDPLATQQDLEGFYEHLQTMMTKTGYFDPKTPRLLPTRLRRLFGRIHLSKPEINILRGFLSSIDKYFIKKA